MNKKIIYFLAAAIMLFNSAKIDAAVFDGRFYPIISQPIQSYQLINNLPGHFKNKIKIVFSDIDGTLIPLNKNGTRGEVPVSVKKSAEKLKKENIPFVLVTGRSSLEAIEIARRAGIEKTYVIAQQGAQIVTPEGKIIYNDNINNQDCKKILNDIDLFKTENHLNSKIFIFLDGELYTKEKVDLPYVFQKITVLNSFNELDKIKSNYTLNKIGIYDTDMNSLKLIQKYLNKKYPKYNIVISADCYCDISSASATKGNAIKKLSAVLGIKLKNAATFGDAENDISMLKLIKKNGGLAIAVENANSKVKSNANYVAPSPSDDGFAKAIDKILQNNSLLK